MNKINISIVCSALGTVCFCTLSNINPAPSPTNTSAVPEQRVSAQQYASGPLGQRASGQGGLDSEESGAAFASGPLGQKTSGQGGFDDGQYVAAPVVARAQNEAFAGGFDGAE